MNAPDYDPDEASSLLAQAGYADSDGDGILDKEGQPLEIVIGGYPERFQLPIMAEAAQAMLADLGIKVEVAITEWSVVNEPAWDLFWVVQQCCGNRRPGGKRQQVRRYPGRCQQQRRKQLRPLRQFRTDWK